MPIQGLETAILCTQMGVMVRTLLKAVAHLQGHLWVAEKNCYDYNRNTCVGGQCLHYTQVVWRNSVRLGCARVQCNNGWWFVTCSYDPPGNYDGQRPYW
ncbi:basic form of pathogenesis-related protein 1 [Quercus suber]